MELKKDILTVPFELRANDIDHQVISIDSRFRDNPVTASSTDFYYSLLAPIRNVLRVRIVSIEFPNNYRTFTAARSNVSLRIIYNVASPRAFVVTIPDGNYNAYEMQSLLRTLIATTLPWLTVIFNPNQGTFIFSGSQYFAVDTAYGSLNRTYDYGLGFYLGFSRGTFIAKTGVQTIVNINGVFTISPNVGVYTVSSDGVGTFSGDTYFFLRLNDFNSVQQTVSVNDGPSALQARNEFTAMAKIVIKEPKNYITYDDNAGGLTKEVVFPSPTDLSRLRIQILNPYGEIMDISTAQFSFAVEVLTVKNLSLYNLIRDSITTQYVT
jgi:hypothetical protein